MMTVGAGRLADAVPTRMPYTELAEGVVAADHGATQRPAGGLAKDASEDVEEKSTRLAEEFPIVTEEEEKHLGDCSDEPESGSLHHHLVR